MKTPASFPKPFYTAGLTALILGLTLSCGATEPPKGALTAAQTDDWTRTAVREWKDSLKSALAAEFEAKTLQIGELTMPLDWRVYGDEPEGGRALYISLHGGGGGPARMNDGQWRNQIRLYQPENCIYLCPRAVINTWDLHFNPVASPFYERIIALCTAYFDINPDKVYVMGYSAGGDGVWRLAPRYADVWAAASMMAGHPGDVSLVNLRNTPFMIWCGANDEAYERNLRCAERIAEMQALHDADPEGYIFEGHIVPDKGHWMDLEDAASVPWMAKFTRNPYPTRVVWRQDEVLRPRFYWVGAPESELAKNKEVRAEYDRATNTIRILSSDYHTLIFSLNDKMLDLDKDVTVEYEGRILFRGKVERKAATISRNLRQRSDPAYAFPAEVSVTL